MPRPIRTASSWPSYLLETYGRRFYLIGSDYIYPRESNRIVRELLRQRRGMIVAERYLDLRAQPSEFKLLMRDVRGTSA